MKEKKYELLITKSKEIVNQYTDIKLTIRQVYYRLVSELIIENNRSQYVYFNKVITKYRQQHLEFADLFQDKTRSIINNSDIEYPYFKFSRIIEIMINKVKENYPAFSYNENLLQDTINIILLEKEALSDLFLKAITSNTILITSRGLNSFSQMNDLRHLLHLENRAIKLYTFTDFDDSGYLIQDNFIYQMKEFLGITFDSIKRIALTRELIEKYHIPINPEAKAKKQATSTHKDYNLPYFVELDAIEPNLLMNIVKDTCNQNYNTDLYNAINKAMKVRNRRLKKAYFKQLKKIDLTKI